MRLLCNDKVIISMQKYTRDVIKIKGVYTKVKFTFKYIALLYKNTFFR